ncbi:NAD(P)-dependent alcohol dehydrogenase [Candidatus Saccharibacteria bacterium]|nr:NAD(P)-dependent alcohol dehydrogenase [Candidatus Saccharibacteria bacterium]
MKQVKARAILEANGSFEPATIDRREVGARDVLIEIKYAGICHSDIHHVRGEWQSETYPLVPGHEIAGIVAEVGSEVTKHKVGDRVGVGCMVNSCGECANCLKGEQRFCLRGMTGTYASVDTYGDGSPTLGGYSTHVVVTEGFVLSIPEDIELDAAAPLLCAGITTYSPLKHWGAGPGKQVAIVGLGGLGHMAVKLAHALGAEVTVLSQSLSKKDDGLKLVNVGAPPKPLSLNVFSLIGQRRSFAGSLIGGIEQTQEMLDFCAEHHLGAEIEVISADAIDEAYERVVKSDVRYRFVIDIATLK